MIRNRLMTALFFFGWATAAAAEQPMALVGILTQITGAVQVTGQGAPRDPLASLWQIIRPGVIVRVPEGGAAGIVCSSHRFVRLRGPASWSLSDKSCAAGEEITPAEYAMVAPETGRFKVVEGLLVLEHEIRNGAGADPLAPLILSPRGAMRSPRPTISWLRSPSAAEYRVALNGRGAHYDSFLKTEDLTCTTSSDGLDICSLLWPADRPDLPPEETFSVGIAARESTAESWRSNDPVEVQTMALTDATVLDSHLSRIESLGWQEATRDAAQAGLFANAGLYTDAAEAYRRAFSSAPSPELRATLADVYLMSGLLDLADSRYRALLNAPPAVQAAATFGLGRVAYARGHSQEAAQQFQKARALYAELKLSDEEVAARRAADKAVARIPRMKAGAVSAADAPPRDRE
jgi:hypothetical protein